MAEKIPFTWYLHDDGAFGEDPDWLIEDNPGLTEELIEKMAEKRPFYEVTLHCEVDSETGDVTLVKAEL